MKIFTRSRKSQEKFADHLMSISTNLITATFASILIIPLSALIRSYISTNGVAISWPAIYAALKKLDVFVFAVLYLSPLLTAAYSRYLALNIYDNLAQEKPKTIHQKIKENSSWC